MNGFELSYNACVQMEKCWDGVTVILKVFDGIGDVFLLKLRPQAQLSDLLHLLSVYQTSSTANRKPHCIFFFTIKE